MHIFASFDASGLPTGFFPDDVWPVPPSGAVEITQAQWLEFLANPGARAWDGSKPVAYTPPAAPPAIPVATPYQITLALNVQGSGPAAAFDAAVVKAKPSDRIRWNARTEPMPADNPLYVRLCGLAGLDPAQLHAAAVTQ